MTDSFQYIDDEEEDEEEGFIHNFSFEKKIKNC